jgi:hypothetical protein
MSEKQTSVHPTFVGYRAPHEEVIVTAPSMLTHETNAMSWTTPLFVEIKMDAEIGAYQPDDYGQEPTVPFAAPVEVEAAE